MARGISAFRVAGLRYHRRDAWDRVEVRCFSVRRVVRRGDGLSIKTSMVAPGDEGRSRKESYDAVQVLLLHLGYTYLGGCMI